MFVSRETLDFFDRPSVSRITLPNDPGASFRDRPKIRKSVI